MSGGYGGVSVDDALATVAKVAHLNHASVGLVDAATPLDMLTNGADAQFRRYSSGAYPGVVSAADELLQAYIEAAGLDEADAALRALAPSDDLPAQVLGDCYDELAAAAADDDDYHLATRLERKAIELGCRDPRIAREMLGWYLLKAGSTVEGEAEFAGLRTERPDGVDVLVTHAQTPGCRTPPWPRLTRP